MLHNGDGPVGAVPNRFARVRPSRYRARRGALDAVWVTPLPKPLQVLDRRGVRRLRFPQYRGAVYECGLRVPVASRCRSRSRCGPAGHRPDGVGVRARRPGLCAAPDTVPPLPPIRTGRRRVRVPVV